VEEDQERPGAASPGQVDVDDAVAVVGVPEDEVGEPGRTGEDVSAGHPARL
jgi:hypothetical protein